MLPLVPPQPGVQPLLPSHGDSASAQPPPDRHSPPGHRLPGYQTGAQWWHEPLNACVRTFKNLLTVWKPAFLAAQYFPLFAIIHQHLSSIHALLTAYFLMFRISRKSPVPPKKEEDKRPHIKKPLNAFMLYMKEMRAKVVAECTLKESAAINQILGRRVSGTGWCESLQLYMCVCVYQAFDIFCPQWHSLSREEQAKYYELARKERQLHSQLYPGWSARDNYVSNTFPWYSWVEEVSHQAQSDMTVAVNYSNHTEAVEMVYFHYETVF